MTRIAFIADVHAANHKRWGGRVVGGINERGRDCVTAIRSAVEVATARSCEALVVLGDLFDMTRPSPPLVAEVARALVAGRSSPVYVLLGNHDRQSQHELDHACASLSLDGRITVVHEPRVIRVGDVHLLMVPYEPGKASEWLASRAAYLAQQVPSLQPSKRAVLCTHAGIWDDFTPGFLKNAHDAVGLGQVRWLADAHSLHSVFAGNWHHGKVWNVVGREDPVWDGAICIPGTCCPTRFDDPSGVGMMATYDSASGDVRRAYVPHTPVFDTCEVGDGDDAHDVEASIRNLVETVSGSASIYFRVRAGAEHAEALINMRDNISSIQADRRVIVHLEIGEAEAARDAVDAASLVVAGRSDLAAYLGTADWKPVAPGTAAGTLRRLEEYRKGAQ